MPICKQGGKQRNTGIDRFNHDAFVRSMSPFAHRT
jgi:hypothetical protein